MANQLTKGDRDFLKVAGISPEPTLAEERLALAQRIARHPAPAQVKVDPQQARLQLIRLALEKMLDALGRRDPQALKSLINALEGRDERNARSLPQNNMTTEQLMEKVIQDIEQMSPQEKAEARKHLDAAQEQDH